MLKVSVKAFWRGCTPSLAAKFSNVGDAFKWASEAAAAGWGSGGGTYCTRLEVHAGSTLMHVFYTSAPEPKAPAARD